MLEAGDQADAAEEDLVRAGVVADVVRVTLPVGEIGQTALARVQRVGHAGARRPGDDVAGADRMLLGLAPLLSASRAGPELEQALALEDDQDLLLGRMAVRRRSLL